MKQLLLPGLRLKDVSVFDLRPGIRFLDKANGKEGEITDVRETGPEVIAAFAKYDGSDKELEVWRLSEAVILG